MKGLRIGRIGRAGGCPAVSPGIISPAGVQMRADECIPAPDDHLAASPNSRVSVLLDGRNDGAAGWRIATTKNVSLREQSKR